MRWALLVGRFSIKIMVLIGLIAITGCSFQVRRTAPDADQAMVYVPPTIKPTESIHTPTPENRPTKVVCEDKLTFIEDLNFPDGTVVKPQATIEKQWKVKNSGVCDWSNKYQIKFKEGDALGATEIQSLYPAKSDTEFVIKITFRAPTQPGYYRGVWQASNPDGMLFGDPFYIDIIVAY